jgi:hypothetical protein
MFLYPTYYCKPPPTPSMCYLIYEQPQPLTKIFVFPHKKFDFNQPCHVYYVFSRTQKKHIGDQNVNHYIRGSKRVSVYVCVWGGGECECLSFELFGSGKNGHIPKRSSDHELPSPQWAKMWFHSAIRKTLQKFNFDIFNCDEQ